MGITTEIAGLAGVRIVQFNTEELIDSKDMYLFLRAVKSRGERILGIEGFFIRDQKLIPDMNAIADFSSIAHVKDSDSVLEAQHFLKSLDDQDRCFEITFL
jgi:hypothetical protein